MIPNAILVMTLIGLVAGVVLAAAKKIFYVARDPKFEAIRAAMPGINCGHCGYAGCDGAAQALVSGKAGINLCINGGPETMNRLARILGLDPGVSEPVTAGVGCLGGGRAEIRYHYKGIRDCRAAHLLYRGPVLCEIGCLGLGSCVRACPYKAIHMGTRGLPVIDEALCRGCGKCAAVCPRGVITLAGFSRRLLHLNRTDDCLAPCRQKCPAQVNVPGMIRDIRRKQYADALLKIKERNPLVLSVGRVCSHPCENICRRNMADEAVAVHHLERFVGEWEMKLGHHIPVFCAPTTGQRVAVIGGGPAGLSCAYFLRRLGHSPTIFERKETLGGMLRYGITEYRLPRHLVDWDIHGIIGLGVEVKTRMSLGRDFTLDELTKDGYGAIFLGLGAWVVPSLCVDGEYLEGVMTSLDFLSRVNVTITTLSGTSAVIIGESNTAVDCARSCIRLGAKSVTMVCPVDQREMSARKNDVTRAMEEGVEMMFTTAPVRILPDSNQRAESLEVCQNEPKEKEGQGGIGRKIPGSEKRIPAALVISAYERKPDMDCLINIQTKKDIGENGVVFKSSRTYTLEAKEDTLMASPPNIFTAGDMHTGRASVITAVAGGRKAARSIHLLLTRGVIPVPDNIQHRINPKSILKKVCVARHIPKVRVQELPVSKRKTSFVEAVGPTIDQTRARVEAGRCLQCGIICNDP